MLQPGDVVTTDFMGATGLKRRPCVVLSSELYHVHRPDVVLAVVTTQLRAAITPTDYILQDWQSAGLNAASAVRMFLATYPHASTRFVGRLTQRDWSEVQDRLRLALATEE